jgi:uncharacterized RDD family membrane protein YckC
VTSHQKLSIDTPEQINLEFELAGPGSRFMALFVDLMIQALCAIAVVIILAVSGFAFRSFRASGNWMLASMVLSLFALQWGYFAIFEILWKGQTPGKRQAGIRVINETGREASVYESVARNLLRVVDQLPGPYAVGAIVMFLSPQSKRIGDYVAGTVVVHDRHNEDEAIFFNTRGEDAPDINYSVLTNDDLRVMETFLQRRLELPLEVRRKTAEKLAQHFRERCSVPEGAHTDNENLLEILVCGFRSSGRSHPR